MKSITHQGGFLLACAGVLLGGVFGSEMQAANKDQHLKFQATTTLAVGDVFSDLNAADKPLEEKNTFQRGETFRLTLKGIPQKGWHTYPILKIAPGQETKPTQVDIKPVAAFASLWPVVESEPAQTKDGFEYHAPFTWTMEILVRPTAPANKPVNIEVEIDSEVCDANHCIFEKQILTVPINIKGVDIPLSSEVENLLKKYDEEIKKKAMAEAVAKPAVSYPWSDLNIVDQTDEANSLSATGLWGTIITAVLGGLIALVTPCVFPMIPITVSFFIKQAEKKHGNPLLMAAVYSGTIVLVLTAGGLALVSVLQMISQHWITNFFLAGVFLVFALSLLGMYDLTLPSGLADRTSSGQGKGGYIGIVFMALTFSIISFACVGPIYGGFITLEAAQQSSVTGWLQHILGPLAFSTAFALPFFLLALFPQLLKAMPKSGSWMNAVKVVMGFLELAAAFMFLRSAEISLLGKTGLFTYDLVLGIYVALSIGCSLYLMGVFRLPHDHEAPESIGVLRLLFSMAFLSVGLYLLPGLFKDDKQHAQKPRGTIYAWVQSFLLPDDRSTWPTDLGRALAEAEQQNKPLFIDFTGQQCKNCKLNENDVFSQRRIEDLFRRYILLQLYTDKVPDGVFQDPNAVESRQFCDDKFKNTALPYYVIVRVKGKTLYVLYTHKEGRISSVDAFAAVLDKFAKPQTQ